MSYVKVTAQQLKRRKWRAKIAKISLLVLAIILTVIYLVLGIVYNGGRFTITLDPNFSVESGIVMYDSQNNKSVTNRLYAENIEFIDNISIDWIKKDIDTEKDGSHNGQNYMAYTFYIENRGKEVLNYWVECYVDDATRNVDEAIRVMMFLNGEKEVYAKKNLLTGEAEKGTQPFYSDDLAVLRQRKDFKPKDVDRYTVVIFLEGDDPDCVDKLIGGEIKMHLDIREEHIEQKQSKKRSK